MDSPLITQFFLGANSRYGFHSLYGGFCPPEEGCFLNVIKGGPGCGKSSFMKRIGRAAEERGLDVEYILCSGDPDSVDAVFIPSLGIGYVDGTSPHTIDSAYPGAAGMYLDLGRFYDKYALQRRTNEIMDLNRRYKAMYSGAYLHLAAGAELMPRCSIGLWGKPEQDKIRKKAAAFSKREFGSDIGKKGRVQERFIDAFSCKGRIFLGETVSSLCSRLCIIDNELGLGHLFLSNTLTEVEGKGLDVIVCRDCLDPTLISALLIPQAELALICSDTYSGEGRDIYRHIRLDAIVNREILASQRPALRKSKRLSRDVLGLAAENLSRAKSLHDELEAIYNPHVDFDGIYSEAERHIKALF